MILLAVLVIIIAISFFTKGGFGVNSTGAGESPPAKSDAENQQIPNEQILNDEKSAMDQFSGAEYALKTKNRESLQHALDRLKRMKELTNPEMRTRRENLIKLIEKEL